MKRLDQMTFHDSGIWMMMPETGDWESKSKSNLRELIKHINKISKKMPEEIQSKIKIYRRKKP